MSRWNPLAIIHAKLLGRSNDAVATFWRVVQWARTPGVSARPGFVDFDQIRALSGGLSRKRTEKVIAELVGAGRGAHASGLLDVVEDGWVIHDFEHYGDEIDIVAPLAPEPVLPPAVSAARSAAGRAGGLRSVESRLATKQTAAPVKQTAKQTHEANGGATKQTAEANTGSSFGSGSGSDLEIREIPKANPRPKDLPGLRAGEVCFDDEEILKIGIVERATMVTDTPDLARLYRPHRWPEVIAVVKAFVVATGRDRGCVAYERDSGVRTVVALLAAFDLEPLLRAIPVAVQTDFWKREPGRPLASLSITVIEDALGRDAAAARAEASRRAELRRNVATRKSTPPPLTAQETLSLAKLAMGTVGNA